MEYDVARAEVLLRDLARIGPGHAPGVQLEGAPGEGPRVLGTCTRFGLLRMAVRLAQAALSARLTVTVSDDGRVDPDGSSVGSLIQVYLADDPPALAPRPARFGWLAWVLACFWVALALGFLTLTAIGFFTVARVARESFGG